MGQIKNIKLHIVTDIKAQCTLRTQTLLSKTNKMRYVAAYLLSSLGGNESPTTNDIKTILESVGVGYDEERAQIVVNQCKGKSIAELIAAGSKRWLLCQREVEEEEEEVVQLRRQLVVVLLQMSKKRKKKRKNLQMKVLTMIWASDFLINSLEILNIRINVVDKN